MFRVWNVDVLFRMNVFFSVLKKQKTKTKQKETNTKQTMKTKEKKCQRRLHPIFPSVNRKKDTGDFLLLLHRRSAELMIDLLFCFEIIMDNKQLPALYAIQYSEFDINKGAYIYHEVGDRDLQRRIQWEFSSRHNRPSSVKINDFIG